MRKLLFVLLFILLITASGCRAEKTLPDDTGVSIPDISTEEIRETEKPPESDSSSVSEETSLPEEETTPVPAQPQEPAETVPPKQTESEAPKQTIPGTSTDPTEKPPVQTESPTPEPEPEETKPSAPETVPPEPNATAADAEQIADLVVSYINAYRTEQGGSSAVHLPGLTQYAEYRSSQIISDFSHNTLDERAAATALSYGMYVDPELYGMEGDPYYTACSGEAIAKAGYVGSADYVAQSLAKLIRNSPEHWCYIGATDYLYIGVGVTYESGMWYCDVALTRENYG